MALPTTKTSKGQDLSRQTILLYGPAKIGKSTLCSKFPDALFISTEPGLEFLSVYEQPVKSWAEFLAICAELAQGKHNFKTVIVDTVDVLVMYCTEYVCQREEINHPSDYDFGKGWSMVSTEFKTKLMKLAQLGFGLVLVSHMKTEEVKTKSKSYNKQTISVTGENRRTLLAVPNLILYMASEEADGQEQGVIYTKPNLYLDAGDRSQLLPETIRFPLNDPGKAYEQIAKHLNQKQ